MYDVGKWSSNGNSTRSFVIKSPVCAMFDSTSLCSLKRTSLLWILEHVDSLHFA